MTKIAFNSGKVYFVLECQKFSSLGVVNIGIKEIIKKNYTSQCSICKAGISEKSPVNDLCQECFNKCVHISSVLEYLQTTSITNLNIIQSTSTIINRNTQQKIETTASTCECNIIVSSPYLIRKNTKERTEVATPIMRIGSSSDLSDYPISDNHTLSRIHAIIQFEGGDYYLSDNNSKNGTKYNGIQLKPGEKIKLKDSDEFFLSNECFVFHE